MNLPVPTHTNPNYSLNIPGVVRQQLMETSFKLCEQGIYCFTKINLLKKVGFYMTSSIFGNIEIQQVTGGTVQFGYTHCISPKSAVKDPSGGGSKNQGAFVCTNTGFSIVNYIDPDVSDQDIDT